MPEAGDRIADRYELVQRLGEGSMGRLCGRDTRLGRVVAIKLHGPGAVGSKGLESASFARHARPPRSRTIASVACASSTSASPSRSRPSSSSTPRRSRGVTTTLTGGPDRSCARQRTVAEAGVRGERRPETDQFALAVIAFEFLSGRTGGSVVEANARKSTFGRSNRRE